MSKPVNDVRSSSFDARYAGVEFSGLIDDAITQAKVATEHGLPDADIRAPRFMKRDRAALLGFLRLLPPSPLSQAHGAPFAVLSAELAGDPLGVNAEATADLRHDLEGEHLQFVSVTGSYKGSRENGFVVLLSGVIAWHTVLLLAVRYDQESVLLVNADRSAALHYTDGRIEAIGTWGPVASVAGLDAWTRDSTGQHYSVKSKHSPYSVEHAIERGWIVPSASRAAEFDEQY